MRDAHAAYDWPHTPQTSTHRTAYTYTGTGCTGGLSVNGNKKPQTTQRNGKHARAHANPRRYDQHDIQFQTIYTRVGRDTDRAVKYTVESVACSNTTVAEPRAGILSRLALQYRRRRSSDAHDDAHGDMFKAPGLTGT
jgi:hypothetical protein